MLFQVPRFLQKRSYHFSKQIVLLKHVSFIQNQFFMPHVFSDTKSACFSFFKIQRGIAYNSFDFGKKYGLDLLHKKSKNIQPYFIIHFRNIVSLNKNGCCKNKYQKWNEMPSIFYGFLYINNKIVCQPILEFSENFEIYHSELKSCHL